MCDESGSLWLTAIDGQAAKITGVSASDLNQILKEGIDLFLMRNLLNFCLQ